MIEDVLANRQAWHVECCDVLSGLAMLPDNSVHCVVTSPPYWSLRDYGVPGQLGLEKDPAEFIANMVAVFREVRRVLHPSGTCWINLGDSYVAGPTGRQDGPIKRDRQHLKELGERMGCGGGNKYSADGDYQNSTNAMIAKGGRYRVDNMRKDTGRHFSGLPAKSLMMMPARVALALQADGWLLRSEITWCKRAPMPESCTDRPTSATEKIYLFAKQGRYFMDMEAVRERTSSNSGYAKQRLRGEANWSKATQDTNGRASFVTVTGNEGNNHLWQDTGTRNMWNYWLLSPESFAAAHFATFPTEIPRRAILAGTSQWCCPECGAPWRRVVEREAPPFKDTRTPGQHTPTGNGKISGSAMQAWINEHPPQTTGWQPTCHHAHTQEDTVPAVVLDPFSGAGTSGLVALRHGRRYIGLELNESYCQMSRDRIVGDSPMFNQVGA